MSRPFFSTVGMEFGDKFVNISHSQRRMTRVTTKIYTTTGTYICLKLFKKGPDDEFYNDQRVTLTVPAFHELIKNVENITMEPLGNEGEPCVAAWKRTEKGLPNKAFAKSSKLC